MKGAIRHARRLLRFVLPYWRGILMTVFFSILAAIGQAGRPFLLIPVADLLPGSTIDLTRVASKGVPFFDRLEASLRSYASSSSDPTERMLLIVAAIGVVLTLLSAVGSYGQEYFGKWVRHRAEIDAQNRVFAHLSTLSLRFFHGAKSGELISKLTNDLALTRKAVEFLCGDLIEQPIKILFTAGGLVLLSWKLSLIGLLTYPLLVIPMVQLGRKIRRSARKRQVQQADVTDTMVQAFAGIRVVKAFHREEEESRRFRNQTDEYFRRSMKVVRSKALARSLTESIYSLGFIAFVLIGGLLIVKGGSDFTVKTFSVFIASLVTMYQPVKALTNAVSEIQESLAGADRLFDLLEERPIVVEQPGAKRLEGIRDGIAFRDVSFAYDGTTVLSGVSFDARRGDVVALVGPSGAGKSTLCDLIARFHDPRSGSIEIDGADIRGFTIPSLLDHIAIVTQEPFLFNTTIEENIRYGRLDSTHTEIEAAARAAHIHEFILGLPERYATVVGERGVKLSGGQKQRITIARAILKDAPILILDEATSSLDSESEAAIQEALVNLMKGRTTFVIAHRLSTVQHADRILVLDNGRLVDQGRHDELLRRDGVYQRLYQLQFRDAPGPGPAE